MEKVFISHSSAPRIILIFLGWGMDATPFSGLSKPGYDILALSDYTDYTCPDNAFGNLLTILAPYREIVVIAWSFGVRIAADFLSYAESKLSITRTIAVNGTEMHIDDESGIPEAIFNGTLKNLSPLTVRKFQRRMFSSADDFTRFQQRLPRRTFESQLAELKVFADLNKASGARWDRALIGSDDAIFPYANQLHGWEGVPADIIEGMPHFPDFQKIITTYVIDKDLVAERFSNARQTYRSNATPQYESALRLWELAQPHLPAPAHKLQVLEIGSGEGMLTELYLPALSDASITLWDIASIPSLPLPESARVECVDAEIAIHDLKDESIDLLLSSSTLQWFNSPAMFIRETARILRHGGIAAFSLFGPGTCKEISYVTGTTLRYPTARQLLDAAKGILETTVCQEKTTQYPFANAAEALKHIKHTGVNALSRNTAENGNPALRLLRHYPLNDDGTASLTYHSIHLLFKKR